MTPALLDRPASMLAERAADEASAAGPLGRGRVTLEERLNSALHESRTNGSSECSVCHGRMTPAREGAAPDAAECGDCGSRLS